MEIVFNATLDLSKTISVKGKFVHETVSVPLQAVTVTLTEY